MTDREMIIDLAAKVMGWEVFPLSRDGYSEAAAPKLIENVEANWVHFAESAGTRHATKTWNPLTSIADAWQIVDKMADRGEVFIVKADGLRSGDHNQRYTVLCGNHPRTDATTAPRAICLAALKAVAA